MPRTDPRRPDRCRRAGRSTSRGRQRAASHAGTAARRAPRSGRARTAASVASHRSPSRCGERPHVVDRRAAVLAREPRRDAEREVEARDDRAAQSAHDQCDRLLAVGRLPRLSDEPAVLHDGEPDPALRSGVLAPDQSTAITVGSVTRENGTVRAWPANGAGGARPGQGLPPRRARSTASTWSCTRASASRCSARTARARPRRCS